MTDKKENQISQKQIENIQQERDKYIKNIVKDGIKAENADGINNGLFNFVFMSLFRKCSKPSLNGILTKEFNKIFQEKTAGTYGKEGIDLSKHASVIEKTNVRKGKNYRTRNTKNFAKVTTLISTAIGIALIIALNITALYIVAFMLGGVFSWGKYWIYFILSNIFRIKKF